MIAFALIDRIHAPELIPTEISRHVKTYCKLKMLDLDQILHEYCKSTLSHSMFAVWNNGVESKFLAIMKCINDPSMVTDILLELMRRTTIPWSKNLQQEFDRAPSFVPARQIEEFNEQLKLMKLKEMLRKYGIEKFNVSDVKMALKLVPFILRNLDHADAIHDAIEVKETNLVC
jgi:hypothetical protein